MIMISFSFILINISVFFCRIKNKLREQRRIKFIRRIPFKRKCNIQSNDNEKFSKYYNPELENTDTEYINCVYIGIHGHIIA